MSSRLFPLGFSLLLLSAPLLPAAALEPGFHEDRRVAAATRLDWKFVAAAFGPGATKLPASYDSRRQRYQLFVPRDHDAKRPWPLVVFLSPGDDPLGWRAWQTACEKQGFLFCAAYGAGNGCPPGQRVRLVLDVLDDVRRKCRVDPERTYLSGFSGGGRVAGTIAFALPEYFGGVVPVGDTSPLPHQDYLRHVVRERLSVALVTGESDGTRKENETFQAPLLRDLGVRSRLWVVPKRGHALPPGEVLLEAAAWLEEDLPRRRAWSASPLAASPDTVPDDERAATRHLQAAETALTNVGQAWPGVALLRGLVERWGGTEAADKARRRLKEVQDDAVRARLVAEEGGRDERNVLGARARAFERLGDVRPAQQAWGLLARNHPTTPEGQAAADAVRRLAEVLARTPFLGIVFAAGGELFVSEVTPRGPGERAGLKAGDRVWALDGRKIADFEEVRQALEARRPGDRLAVEVRRAGKPLTLTVELGALPGMSD